MPLEVQAPASHLPRIPRRDSRTGHEERSVIRPAVFPLQGAVPVQQKSCQHPHFTGSKPPSPPPSYIYSREIATTCLCSASCQRQRKVRWKSLRATARRIILPSQNHAARTPSWCQHQPSRCFSSGAVRWLVKFFGGAHHHAPKKWLDQVCFFAEMVWCRAQHDDPLAPVVAIAVSPVEESHRGEGIPFSPSETVAQSRRAHSRSL